MWCLLRQCACPPPPPLSIQYSCLQWLYIALRNCIITLQVLFIFCIHPCMFKSSELSVSQGNIFRHLTVLRGFFTLRLKINSSAAVNFKVKRSKKRLTFWEMNLFFPGQEFEEKIETILISFHSEYSYSEHLVSLA